MTHPYTITRRELSEEMLGAGRKANALRDGNCLGLQYVAPEPAYAAMLAASDKPGQVLTETEGMRIVVDAWLKGGHVITTNAAAHIARAVEAAILAKLA